MKESSLALAGPGEISFDPSERQARATHHQRIRVLVTTYFAFIWRSLRRLGVPDAHVDDAAQQVFVVAARKIGNVPPAGEQAFLFAVALRVAADDRRARRRRPELASIDVLHLAQDERLRPDDLLEQQQARALLDRTLEGMPLDLRTVFVLFELEEMTMNQIAALLEIPLGTVASRLRRSREAFDEQVARFQARSARRGNP